MVREAMPRQNRVTPFGDVVALDGRGLLMGNRGVLHDARQRIVRYAQVRRWIACRTEFRGRRRPLMQPRSYTELFFLDDAAALAAGHRPCAECRHADYQRFRAAWTAAHPGEIVTADTIDARLDGDRRAGHTKRTYAEDVSALPDGAYVAVDGRAWLVWGAELLAWSAGGYVERASRPGHGETTVITPASIVRTIEAGYVPALHPSAGVNPLRPPCGSPS
jgi:hypothetical protein